MLTPPKNPLKQPTRQQLDQMIRQVTPDIQQLRLQNSLNMYSIAHTLPPSLNTPLEPKEPQGD